MESKGTFFILIIVVAVLALTLAVLAGYIFLVQGNSTNNSKDNTSGNTTVSTQVPEEKDLAILELYDGKKYFNLKNEDNSKNIAIIQVNIALKYFISIKEDKKIKVEEKLNNNILEIKELIGTYFMHVTLEDAKKEDAKEKAKTELKKQINDLLNVGESKQPHEYVYKVIIDEWLYQ